MRSDPQVDIDSLNATVAQLGAEAVARVQQTMASDLHMKLTGKRTLAKHVREWHGTHRITVPYALLEGWTVEELQQAHRELHS